MSAVRGKPDADPTWRPPLLLTQLRHEHSMICAARMNAVHHSPRRLFLLA